MAFLKVNGWTVPIATWSEQAAFVGGADKMSYTGRVIKNRRAIRRRWSVKTQLLAAPDAVTLRRLLTWESHAWSWDVDYFSARGLWPNAVPTLSYDTAVVKYGAQSLAASGTCINAYTLYDFALADGWTVMCWAQRPANGSAYRTAVTVQMPVAFEINGYGQIVYTSGNAIGGRLYTAATGTQQFGLNAGIAAGWHHVALTYDQKSESCIFYLDGVAQGSGLFAAGAAFNSSANGGPAVMWGNQSGSLVWGGQIDDCVVLPLAASPNYIAAVAANNAAHGPFPEVVCSGTFAPDAPILCVPSDVTVSRTAAYLAGTFATTQAAVEFTLSEVS